MAIQNQMRQDYLRYLRSWARFNPAIAFVLIAPCCKNKGLCIANTRVDLNNNSTIVKTTDVKIQY